MISFSFSAVALSICSMALETDFLRPFAARALVFGDLFAVFQLFEHVHRLAADVAHGDLRLFGQRLDLLGDVAAALFGEVGEDEADDFAVVGGVEPDVRTLDRVFIPGG